MIFELIESVTNNVSSYTWDVMFAIESDDLLPLTTNGKLLSFHPYHEVAFFHCGTNLYFYSIEDLLVDEVQYNKLAYDYIKHCGTPLLDCIAPFACTLEKKVNYCSNFILISSVFFLLSLHLFDHYYK
jgi:hypothetical protein